MKLSKHIHCIYWWGTDFGQFRNFMGQSYMEKKCKHKFKRKAQFSLSMNL